MRQPNQNSAERDRIVGVTPLEEPCPELVIGLCRAGALGVLDVGRQAERAAHCLELIVRRVQQPFGVRIPAGSPISPDAVPEQASTVILAQLQDLPAWRSRRVLVEVTSVTEALDAAAAGADGLIAKGCESGGRVSDAGSFVLLQQLLRCVQLPIWVQGGIGEHTAAAAIAGGAVGVVLDSQLLLARESALPEAVRAAIAAMDGSETVVLAGHRLYTRPDLPIAKLSEVDPAQIVPRLGGRDLHGQYLPVGQDAALAQGLARRFKTAGGIAHALRTSIGAHIAAAQRLRPLAAGAPFAASHGIRYPIAQGPMTRVSDRAAFAAAVATEGALPFLALALMSAAEVRELLEQTVALLGRAGAALPWGVGILGFVPQEIRDAQLAVVREFRPPVALIAGGRPAQARALEEDGIATYLHVPSPGLLRQFLKDGARRFVFEGRECGGHVGPRTSFVLWETQIETLLASDDVSELHVLFAGGIHDRRSAAMVAALSARLAERGARVGILMGSAYVLTEEAVSTGAIAPSFQEEIRRCAHTALLETSPGHAIRVADTQYVAQFAAEKQRLQQAGKSTQEIWYDLEQLNLGRLRLASKGLRREGEQLREVDAAEQLRDGMFMIGQVATLRERVIPMAELHREACEGACAFLDALGTAEAPARVESPLDIAIVGMAGCFPQAADVDAFWTNVVRGVDAITEVPAERWDVERYYDPEAVKSLAGVKSPSKWGGFLPAVPFDALSYGIPPRSLGSIEPAQLLALDVARRALADAGYADREFDRSRTAVVFGAAAGTDLSAAYGFRSLYPQYCGPLPEALDRALPRLSEDSFPGVLANVIAGRIANRLDLGGANYTVDAACAASLAALAQACKELATGSSDMVLCGAADLHNGIGDYLLFSSVHALSAQGRCRAFDADADGIALGEAVACVVLKRRADAERDGDRIYAVIQGIAGSSDGRSLGLTAPRPDGQRRAIERAFRQAAISPADVRVVEAHGTGTVVGDRTELSVLTELYREAGAVPEQTALGSVKSQIGHTKCAAGLAGLVKSAWSLYCGVRAPTLHVRKPNDYYDAETSPFHFAATVRPWPDAQRHASLSAFGFGGSNFHAVLSAYEGADLPARGLRHWPAELVLIRGESRDAAQAELARLGALLDANAAIGSPWRLRDVARTLSEASAAPVQIALVAESLSDLREKSDSARAFAPAPGVFVRDAQAPGAAGKIAFLFPGQGSQRVGMLAELFSAFPRLQEFLRLGSPWLEAIYPAAAFSPAERAAQQDRLTDTGTAQPALGMADLAMGALLGEFGVKPDMAAGHSYGELAALCSAGVFSPQVLIELSAARAHAILEAAGEDPGAMAAVEGAAGDVERVIAGLEQVVVANENAPAQVVISGPSAALGEALQRLEQAGFAARRIPVACAFHSPVVAGAAELFAKHLTEIPIAEPRFAVWSNTTARPYPGSAATTMQLLAQQIVSPVHFRAEIEGMYAAGARIFVEAGPGRVLSGLVRKTLGDRPHRAICCDVPGESGLHRLLYALGELAALGVPIDVRALYAEREAQRVDLAAVQRAKPMYLVNGYTIRRADGELLAEALQPADALAELARVLPGGAAAAAAEPAHAAAVDPREVAIQGFLRGMRESVAAQREVMLAYLGAPPAVEAAAPVLREFAEERAQPAPAALRAVPEVRSAGTAAAPVRSEPPTRRGDAPPSGAQLMATVLAIVSERTGYPLEMLEPDLDLEADLSIDSIKRLEILGELSERVELLAEREEGLDESSLEQLARLKTLRQIVAWIDARRASEAPPPPSVEPVAAPAPPAPAAPAAAAPAAAPPPRALRYSFELEALPAPSGAQASWSGRRVAITGGPQRLREELGARIRARGGELLERGAGDGAHALVQLAALDPQSDFTVVGLFEQLRALALSGVRSMRVATALGGSCGFDLAAAGSSPATPERLRGAGVRGLVKSFAREFPELSIRAVDLHPGEDPARLAEQLIAELDCTEPRLEVGYASGRRCAPRLVAAPLVGEYSPASAPLLDADSIVLVTGGARGIAAQASLALGRTFGCQLELVGRSSTPTAAERAALARAADARALRAALVAEGQLRKPAQIEAECARLLAAREIRGTLAALRELGVRYQYHALDVRDPAALAALVRGIYARHGRLDGVIHAAGILEDRWIRDKTPESFRRVFDTKVSAFRTLAEELRDDVVFVVSFGSIAGAFGNRGQVDYAAANDALATLGRALAARISGRVVTLDWGPWSGAGMVSAELAQHYERLGVGLIDPEDGVQCLLDELRLGERNASECVYMRAEPERVMLASADPAAASVRGAGEGSG